MAREWDLDIQAGQAAGTVGTLRLLVKGKQDGGVIEVVASCRSIDDFATEIGRVKGELDGLLEKARQKVKAIQGGSFGSVDPAQAWKKMEAASTEREMFDYFNRLEVLDRERIADYVLTQVSMFKGRGPIFSEHYEAATHLLE